MSLFNVVWIDLENDPNNSIVKRHRVSRETALNHVETAYPPETWKKKAMHVWQFHEERDGKSVPTAEVRIQAA